MRVCNLSSSSDGNLTYIETTNAKVLLDAGLSATEIKKRLALLQVLPEEIDAILITHEHSDHIKGVDVFATKYGTKVYVHTKGHRALVSKLKKAKEIKFVLFDDLDFYIKDLRVINFSLPHDSAYCSGYEQKQRLYQSAAFCPPRAGAGTGSTGTGRCIFSLLQSMADRIFIQSAIYIRCSCHYCTLPWFGIFHFGQFPVSNYVKPEKGCNDGSYSRHCHGL